MSYLYFQVEAAVLLVVFYLIYKLIIRNSSQFLFKRIFILTSLLIAYTGPFIKIPIQKPQIVHYYQQLPAVIVSPALASSNTINHNYQFWVLVIISIVSFTALFFFVKQLIELFILIKTSSKKRDGDFYVIETCNQDAFSFFYYIFIGKVLPGNSRDTILKHEKIHARNLHSIDNLIVEIIFIMQWFNPAVWLFRKALKENHEFETDIKMLNSGVSMEAYQQLLLNYFFKTNDIRFSSFNYNSFIKNRIKMMTNMNFHAGKTRFLLAAVMCLFVVSVFSFKVETNLTNKVLTHDLKIETVTSLESQSPQPKTSKDDVPLLVPEQRAKFQGSEDVEVFHRYVMENIKYPADAVKKKMQGKVYTQFIVERDGKIKVVNVLRSSNYSILDDEAIRVIKNSPAWEPAKDKGKLVRMIFTIPIEFKLK